jgi:Tol biopolymer transport system component
MVVRSRRLALAAIGAASLLVLVRCVGDSGETSPVTTPDSGGTDSGSTTTDGSTFPSTDAGSDAPVDSGPPRKCDPTAVFTSINVLQGFSSADNEATPRLSPDELTLYYFDANATASNVLIATRTKRTDPFGAPTKLPINDVAHPNADPTVSTDGLTLYWAVGSFPTGFGQDIWMATRNTVNDPFSNPKRVDGILTTASKPDDGGIFDGWPFLSSDGSQLWFTSTRSRPNLQNVLLSGNDIYVATKSGGQFSVVTPVPELNTDAGDAGSTIGSGGAVLSADGLTIYLSSNRAGTVGQSDIWVSHRTTTASIWPTPTNVAEVNTAKQDLPGWLSPDNCRLYFTSDRQGTGDLFVAERTPK